MSDTSGERPGEDRGRVRKPQPDSGTASPYAPPGRGSGLTSSRSMLAVVVIVALTTVVFLLALGLD